MSRFGSFQFKDIFKDFVLNSSIFSQSGINAVQKFAVLNFFHAHRVSAKELCSKRLNLFAIRHKCRTEIRRTRKEFSPLSPYLISFNIPSKNNQRVTRLFLNFFHAHRVSAKELRSKSLNLFAIRHKCRTEIRRTQKEFSPLSPYLISFNIPSKK